MSKNRVNPFEAPVHEIASLDKFLPKKRSDAPTISQTEIDKIADQTGFPSRDAQINVEKSTAKRGDRRYRTGRNTQISLRATAEIVEQFYAIADQMGVSVVVAFEQAVMALVKEQNQIDPGA